MTKLIIHDPDVPPDPHTSHLHNPSTHHPLPPIHSAPPFAATTLPVCHLAFALTSHPTTSATSSAYLFLVSTHPQLLTAPKTLTPSCPPPQPSPSATSPSSAPRPPQQETSSRPAYPSTRPTRHSPSSPETSTAVPTPTIARGPRGPPWTH